MEETQTLPPNIAIALQNAAQELDVVKRKPFVLVYRITDSGTGEPLARRRIRLEFTIQASAAPSTNLPNLIKYKNESDYTKQITDDNGDLACTFTIDDISRKFDSQGLVITAQIEGTTNTSKSPLFRVLSKRKKEQNGPPSKMQRISEKLEALEERIRRLEEK